MVPPYLWGHQFHTSVSFLASYVFRFFSIFLWKKITLVVTLPLYPRWWLFEQIWDYTKDYTNVKIELPVVSPRNDDEQTWIYISLSFSGRMVLAKKLKKNTYKIFNNSELLLSLRIRFHSLKQIEYLRSITWCFRPSLVEIGKKMKMWIV